MNQPLEQLRKQELMALLQKERAAVSTVENTSKSQEQLLLQKQKALQQKEDQVLYLKAQVAQLQRMLFGQKREGFEGDNQQLPLPFQADPQQEEKQQEELLEKMEYVRKKVCVRSTTYCSWQNNG